MPEEETQNQNPTHLVVEKALFSRTATSAPQAADTRHFQPPAEQTESAADEAVEQDAADYSGAGGILGRLGQLNLFYVILVPMVLIEIVLLFFVFKG